MSLWLEIARILAKESAYRSVRQRETLKTPSFWRGSGSIIEVNFIPAIISTGISLLFGFLMLSMPSAFFFVMLGAIELLMAFLSIASLTSIMASQGLLEPLTYRPVDESTLRRAVMAASFLYWGVGSFVLVVIPASMVLAIGRGSLYPIVAGIAMAVTLLIIGYGIGLFVASFAPSVRSDPRLRLLATIGWILLLLVGYLPNILTSIFRNVSIPDVPGFGNLAELIPPLNYGVLALGTFSPLTVASILVTFVLSLALLNFSSNRFWRTLSQGITTTSGLKGRQLKVKAKWSVRAYGPLIGLSMKDLKLLVRSPQRLARFLVYSIIPLVFILPLLTAPTGDPIARMIGSKIVEVLPLSVFFFGISSDELFYVEGESSRDLYRLPLTKRRLALSKALSAFLGLLPAGLVLAALATYLSGILQGILTSVLFEVDMAASLLINCCLLTSMLPTEPSGWSERSFGQKALGARLLMMFFGFILLGIAATVAFTTPFGLVAVIGLSVFGVASALFAYRRLRDEPLAS